MLTQVIKRRRGGADILSWPNRYLVRVVPAPGRANSSATTAGLCLLAVCGVFVCLMVRCVQNSESAARGEVFENPVYTAERAQQVRTRCIASVAAACVCVCRRRNGQP